MDKIIVTDMDDVLVNFLETWVSQLNATYNKDIKTEDIKDWGMNKFYPELSFEQLYGILNKESFWKLVEPKKGSPETLKRMKEDGYQVYVCTAAHYDNISPKVNECLIKYYPWLTYKDIIICHKKDLLTCNYIIDDYTENIRKSKAIRFLMDAPYNQHARLVIDYDFRVKSMEEVYNIIKELEKKEIA